MTCSVCKQDKDISLFPSSGKGAYRSYCKACRNIRERKYAVKALPRQKLYYAMHKDEIKKKNKKYRTANKDKIAAINKKYRLANIEHKKAIDSAWYESHKNDALFKHKRINYIKGPGKIKRLISLTKYNSKADVKDKILARRFAGNSIRYGKLLITGKCQFCGSMEKIEKHHPDYRKPLEIIELCQRCHKLEHKLEKKYGVMAELVKKAA